MILDFRSMGQAEALYVGGRVLVDGKSIELAWYIDTDAGLVRTYDVFGDGRVHWFGGGTTWPAGVMGDGESAAWIEIRGRVELLPPEATKC